MDDLFQIDEKVINLEFEHIANINEIENAVAEGLNEIDSKGNQYIGEMESIRDSIPVDYSALSNHVNELDSAIAGKADASVVTEISEGLREVSEGLEELSETVETNTSNISGLQTDVSELSSTIVNQGKQIEDIGEVVAEHSETIVDAEKSGFYSKNILENTIQTQTKNGITITRNADGSITLNGTNNKGATFTDLYINKEDYGMKPYESGEYILSMGMEATNNIALGHWNNATNVSTLIPIGSSEMRINWSTSATRYNIYVSIGNGATFNNVVIKPMLRRAEVTDDTYEPYVPSNKTLSDEIASKANNINFTGNWVGTVGQMAVAYSGYKADVTSVTVTFPSKGGASGKGILLVEYYSDPNNNRDYVIVPYETDNNNARNFSIIGTKPSSMGAVTKVETSANHQSVTVTFSAKTWVSITALRLF